MKEIIKFFNILTISVTAGFGMFWLFILNGLFNIWFSLITGLIWSSVIAVYIYTFNLLGAQCESVTSVKKEKKLNR